MQKSWLLIICMLFFPHSKHFVYPLSTELASHKDKNPYFTTPSFYSHYAQYKVLGISVSEDTVSAIMVLEYVWDIHKSNFDKNLLYMDLTQDSILSGKTSICPSFTDFYITDSLGSTAMIERIETNLYGLINYNALQSCLACERFREIFEYMSKYKNIDESLPILKEYYYLNTDIHNRPPHNSHLDSLFNQCSFITPKEAQLYNLTPPSDPKKKGESTSDIRLRLYIAFNIHLKGIIYRDDAFIIRYAKPIKYTTDKEFTYCRAHPWQSQKKHLFIASIDTLMPLSKQQIEAMGFKPFKIDHHKMVMCGDL